MSLVPEPSRPPALVWLLDLRNASRILTFQLFNNIILSQESLSHPAQPMQVYDISLSMFCCTFSKPCSSCRRPGTFRSSSMCCKRTDLRATAAQLTEDGYC